MDEAIARAAAAGFDIAHAFDTALVRELAGEGRLGILVGNTRALWPCFQAARRAEPDPLDRYTERTLDAAFAGARIYYSHRTYDGAYLPFQHVAVAAGLGALAPSGLVVHPVFGPWFALRAIVVADGTPPPRAQIAQPCRCDTCPAAFAAARATPHDWRAWVAVRDACSLRTARYSDEQIRYHYSHAFPGDLHPSRGEPAPEKPR